MSNCDNSNNIIINGDYNSDMGNSTDTVLYHQPKKPQWLPQFFGGWNKSKSGHHLLPTSQQHSPSISASTTATNLSNWDLHEKPLVTKNRRMGTLEENLRVAQPEIEPLQGINEKGKANLVTTINGDSACNLSIYNETTTEIYEEAPPTQPPDLQSLLKQVLAALSVSIVSMAVGYSSAYSSPATSSMASDEDLNITSNQISWVGGLMPLAALVGGVAGGPLIEYVGRRWTIIITTVLLVISWIVIAASPTIECIYVGRSITGVGVGIASLVLPVYLGETVQPEVRGTLGLLPTALGNTGILVCFIVGNYLEWSNLAWLGAALPLPFLILAVFIPETPRWYISKGKDEAARTALQWLRGKSANVDREYNELNKSQIESEKNASNSALLEVFSGGNLKPLVISLGLMFFQQMSGINAVIFYTVTIFKMSGSQVDENLSTIIVGIVNFVSTFIATLLIDRLGRKVLLYISSVSMVITLGILGTYFYVKESVNVEAYGWVPLTCFVIYVLGFSLGFGPIPWLMMGEILPTKIRGSAASVATSFNWACTFIVTKTFINIIDALGAYGAFWLFAVISAVGLIFVIIWVPETQGQSLADIEKKFTGLKVRRMSSVANLKPMPSTF